MTRPSREKVEEAVAMIVGVLLIVLFLFGPIFMWTR